MKVKKERAWTKNYKDGWRGRKSSGVKRKRDRKKCGGGRGWKMNYKGTEKKVGIGKKKKGVDRKRKNFGRTRQSRKSCKRCEKWLMKTGGV